MKYFYTVLFCFINVALFAQPKEFYPYTYIPQKRPATLIQVIISIDSSFNKRGKLIKYERNEYNEKGKLVYKNNNNKEHEYFSYFKDSVIDGKVKIKNNDTVDVWKYIYNEADKPIKYIWGKSLTKPLITKNIFYDEQNRMIKTENRNKKNILTGFSEIKYNDSGTVAEQKYFDGNGKLTRVYTYECNPKGEMLKSVKQINYCSTKQTLENGSFVEIVEDNIGKNNYKRIYTYSSDSLLLSYEFINYKGKNVYKVLYNYMPERFISSIKVYKNNKHSYSNIYSYNQHGLKTEFKSLNEKDELLSNTKTYYVLRDKIN